MKHITYLLSLVALLALGTTTVLAQSRVTVKGVVTSADDSLPLIGVSVISGPTSGVSTSFDGSYSISVEEGTTLIFQYIGYQPHEWVVPTGIAEVEHNVALQSEAQALDEVVVVAYGVRKKGTIAGSVSTVKSEKLESVPAAGFDQALQGQSPGLMVLSNSGEPSKAAPTYKAPHLHPHK